LLISLTLPRTNEYMTAAVIRKIYVGQGELLTVGAKFLDFIVDLSASVQHDCPPIQHYRLAVRDRAWLRRLAVAAGEEVAIGSVLALLTTEPDEPLDGAPARIVRVSVAGIIDSSDWWMGGGA